MTENGGGARSKTKQGGGPITSGAVLCLVKVELLPGFPRQGTTSPHHHLHQNLSVSVSPRLHAINAPIYQSIDQQSINHHSINQIQASIASHYCIARAKLALRPSPAPLPCAKSTPQPQPFLLPVIDAILDPPCLLEGPCPALPCPASSASCHSRARCGPSPLAAVADQRVAHSLPLDVSAVSTPRSICNCSATPGSMRIKVSSKQRRQSKSFRRPIHDTHTLWLTRSRRPARPV
ncbi:hypothetical protein IWX90DRAFT_318498 [Phyllosticta citrichinensis]|uniref:Uncharacterized protein n=1 Tax=Phyllosticta citrichinensis TaxID=1130410 RepID=A0ABR1XJJ3_9PEZI